MTAWHVKYSPSMIRSNVINLKRYDEFFALCVVQRSIEYKTIMSAIGIERILARRCAIVAEKCRKPFSNGKDIRRSTQNTSSASYVCLLESTPSYPAAVSSLFSGWMQTPQILKETVSQSVSPSEESCVYVCVCRALFPFVLLFHFLREIKNR